MGALAVTAVAALIDIVFPLLTKVAVDAASGGESSATRVIAGIAALIALLGVVRFGCQYGRRMLAGRLSLDVQHDLRLGLLGSLQRLDGRGQDQIRTGQVVSRSITDLQLVQGLLSMVPMSAGVVLQFVLALVIMAWLSPLLTLVALVVVPAVALVVYLVRPTLFAATWSAQQRAADLAQHVEETVTGVRVVKGFGQESRAVDQLEGLGRTLYAERLRAARINARFAPSMAAIPQLGLVGVVGARRVPGPARPDHRRHVPRVRRIRRHHDGRDPHTVAGRDHGAAVAGRGRAGVRSHRHRTRGVGSTAPDRPSGRPARRPAP